MERRMGVGIVLAISLALGSSASAQSSAFEGMEAGDAHTANSQHSSSEWDAYYRAYDLLQGGSRAEGLEMLRQLVADSPNHPAAAQARRLYRSSETSIPLELPVPPPPRAEFTGDARTELLTFQSFAGMMLGGEICLLSGCFADARPWVLASVAGSGLGLGIAVLGTRHGIRSATAQAVNTGTLWGALNGYALSVTLGDVLSQDLWEGGHGLDSQHHLAIGLMVGQLAGAGLGYVLDRWIQPSAGSVSLVSSGAIWSTMLTVLIGLSARADFFGEHVRGLHWGLMAAADAGLLLGGLWAHLEPMSRGRVLFLDLGAAVGLGLATGVAAAVVAHKHAAPSAVYGPGMIGLVGGAAFAYWLTRNLDVDDLPLNVGITPVEGGASASIGASF